MFMNYGYLAERTTLLYEQNYGQPFSSERSPQNVTMASVDHDPLSKPNTRHLSTESTSTTTVY